MTVGELKLFLSDKPDFANCFFTIWDGNAKNFELRLGGGKKLFTGSDDRQYIKLGHSDNCNAHIMDVELK